MSAALDRVHDLVRAGFTGMLHRDEHGEIIAVQATRVHAGHIETVLIHDEHDALAARCRDENDPVVVWHRAGFDRRRHRRAPTPARTERPECAETRRGHPVGTVAPPMT